MNTVGRLPRHRLHDRGDSEETTWNDNGTFSCRKAEPRTNVADLTCDLTYVETGIRSTETANKS
jgi:hypothetical protein